MTNNSRQNPFYVDTTGSLISVGCEVMITGIVVAPTNATWAIVLKDGAGNTVYTANNVGGVPIQFPCVPFMTTGLECTTATAIVALIYTIPA